MQMVSTQVFQFDSFPGAASKSPGCPRAVSQGLEPSEREPELLCFTNNLIYFPRTNLLCRELPTGNQAAGKTSSMYPFILICSFPTSAASFLSV